MKNISASIKYLLLFLSLAAYAEEYDSESLFQQEPIENLTPDKVKSNPEIFTINESLLQDDSGDEGLYSEEYYTKSDSLSFSIGYQIAQDLEKSTKLSVIDFQIHKKIASYKDQWWGFQYKSIKGEYSIFANELDPSTDPNSDRSTTRGSNIQAMNLIGFGLGYRFKALTAMFNSDRVFENIMAYANYVTNTDSTNSKEYTGYGLTTEYSIQRRFSQYLFFNFKIGYNLASISREQENDEKKEDRSLVFKWTTLGLDFGYYF